MNVRELIADDDAVSPVIGVILMVAITVILAAVIGTFVLGLGDQVQENAPQASFTFDYDTAVDGTADANVGCISLTDNGSPKNGGLKITHDGGDKIDGSLLDVKSRESGSSAEFQGDCGQSEVAAGDQIEVGIDSDDVARVVWTAESGGNSATLGKFTGPDA